jgi:hypothetical protein
MNDEQKLGCEIAQKETTRKEGERNETRQHAPFNGDILPSTSIVIFWVKSPRATAAVTIALDP